MDRFVWRRGYSPRAPADAKSAAAPAGAGVPSGSRAVSGSDAPAGPGAHVPGWSGAGPVCRAAGAPERQSDLLLPAGPLPLTL